MISAHPWAAKQQSRIKEGLGVCNAGREYAAEEKIASALRFCSTGWRRPDVPIGHVPRANGLRLL